MFNIINVRVPERTRGEINENVAGVTWKKQNGEIMLELLKKKKVCIVSHYSNIS